MLTDEAANSKMIIFERLHVKNILKNLYVLSKEENMKAVGSLEKLFSSYSIRSLTRHKSWDRFSICIIISLLTNCR